MMKKHNLILKKLATIFVVLLTILSMVVVPPAQACSRFVYQGSSNGPITARSMDWYQDPDARLWVFPRGMARNGGAGDQSIEWTSKYGSIVTSSYDVATVDGINEKGLVTNILFLEETDYGEVEPGDNTLAVGAWGQYVLDNYATVDEAVEGLQEKNLKIVTATFEQLESQGILSLSGLSEDIQAYLKPMPFSLHMAISDQNGDSAIVEYIKGEQVIHHSKEYDVLTNDPIYEKQLAFNSYWDYLNNPHKLMPGVSFLPGSSDPSSRFIRASYYLRQMNGKAQFHENSIEERRSELAAALGIIRNISDPLGLDSFAFSTTQWRSVASQNQDPSWFTYLFEYTKSPNLFWLSMNKQNFDLENGARVMALETINSLNLVGEVSGDLKPTCPFSWDLSFPLDD